MEQPNSTEHILVCVSYGPNATRLIQRGAKLASVWNAPLTVVTVEPEGAGQIDDYRQLDHVLWRSLAEDNGAEFLIARGPASRAAHAVIGIAIEKRATQIVVGESARSRWEELTKGSFLQAILHQLSSVEIHVVPIRKEPFDQSPEFETGVPAWLVQKENRLVLSFQKQSDIQLEGLFYKRTNTDFDNGIFQMRRGQQLLLYRVKDGIVTDQIR
ncbi:universal stress protein [Paenibacillus sp. GCM10027627]|uniref:universal stress protein n=1 Tax=unclassified Paenibacillus TaxID=185978 RepID=UPI003625ECA9